MGNDRKAWPVFMVYRWAKEQAPGWRKRRAGSDEAPRYIRSSAPEASWLYSSSPGVCLGTGEYACGDARFMLMRTRIVPAFFQLISLNFQLFTMVNNLWAANQMP